MCLYTNSEDSCCHYQCVTIVDICQINSPIINGQIISYSQPIKMKSIQKMTYSEKDSFSISNQQNQEKYVENMKKQNDKTQVNFINHRYNSNFDHLQARTGQDYTELAIKLQEINTRVTNIEAAYFRQQITVEGQQSIIQNYNKKLQFLYISNKHLEKQINYMIQSAGMPKH